MSLLLLFPAGGIATGPAPAVSDVGWPTRDERVPRSWFQTVQSFEPGTGTARTTGIRSLTCS